MEQQQIKVSFSLGTKLLISVVLLLFVVIIFLNVSTILLFRDDKRAYTYKSQATESVLAGREFVNMARHGLDTLKISLSSVDPRAAVTPQQRLALKTVVDNQIELLAVEIAHLNRSTGERKPIASARREKDLAEYGVEDSDLVPPIEQVKAYLPELESRGYAFLSLTKIGKAPLLGVLVADLNLKSLSQGMPIAFGVISLKAFGAELRGLSLTIATRSGWVLFDTNAERLATHRTIQDDPLFKASQASQLANGATEFDAEDVHYLGSYVRPGLDLVVMSRTEWMKAMKATYTLTEKFVLLGFMAIGAAIIFAILFAKTLTAPIQRLYDATKEVAQGHFDLSLDDSAGDEIGALSGSFNVMSRKISELIKESMEKVHLENELAIASTVQETLIPPAQFDYEKIKIRSHYQSAGSCGGDWWGFFGVGKKFAIMIADATGHGFGSALITASARSCFSVMQKLATEDPDFTFSPSAMLSYANRAIFDASMGKIMMTFFCGVIDFEEGQFTYSSAGHNPPWLFKKENGGYKLNSMIAEGQRLGEVRDYTNFEEKKIAISPGDVLFLYTDGLTEGKDSSGEMYGKKRVRKVIEAAVPSGPDDMIKNVMAEFLKHNGEKPLDDDVTIAAAMILPGGGAAPA